MEVINHKLITFQIYQQIIQDCLNEAQKYSRHQLTKELSNEYLKVIDELIQIINDKHKQDFLLDRYLTVFIVANRTHSGQYIMM